MRTRYDPTEASHATAVAVSPNAKPSAKAGQLKTSEGGSQKSEVGSPASASALRRVSFGKLAVKKDESAKTSYPVFPDANGEAAIIAARILENTTTFEALKGALEIDKAELKIRTLPHYFTINHGRTEVPSSLAVNSPAGEVLVCFQNRYPSLTDESALTAALGDRLEQFFAQTFELKIKSEKLPQAKAQEIVTKLQELFAEYNATDAIEVKEGVKPLADFHAKRHLELDVAQNLALEQVCPIVAQIKTKGRGKEK